MRKLTSRDDRREAQYLRDALVGGEVTRWVSGLDDALAGLLVALQPVGGR